MKVRCDSAWSNDVPFSRNLKKNPRQMTTSCRDDNHHFSTSCVILTSLFSHVLYVASLEHVLNAIQPNGTAIFLRKRPGDSGLSRHYDAQIDFYVRNGRLRINLRRRRVRRAVSHHTNIHRGIVIAARSLLRVKRSFEFIKLFSGVSRPLREDPSRCGRALSLYGRRCPGVDSSVIAPGVMQQFLFILFFSYSYSFMPSRSIWWWWSVERYEFLICDKLRVRVIIWRRAGSRPAQATKFFFGFFCHFMSYYLYNNLSCWNGLKFYELNHFRNIDFSCRRTKFLLLLNFNLFVNLVKFNWIFYFDTYRNNII